MGRRSIWTTFKINISLKSCINDTLNQHKPPHSTLEEIWGALYPHYYCILVYLKWFSTAVSNFIISNHLLGFGQLESSWRTFSKNPLFLHAICFVWGPQSNCIWTHCSFFYFSFFKVWTVSHLWEPGLVSALLDLFRKFLPSYL